MEFIRYHIVFCAFFHIFQGKPYGIPHSSSQSASEPIAQWTIFHCCFALLEQQRRLLDGLDVDEMPFYDIDQSIIQRILSKKTNGLFLKCPVVDGETEVDLLVPVESALNSDPRVFRAKGIDSLPAIGIQRGVEIAVPYRLYLPRRFFPQFSLLASVKPMDRRGGYLFAIVNPYDTLVDVGVLLEPAGSGQTNISLIYSSRRDATSHAIASFVVPEFVQQWTQIAFEVNKDSVTLYFKCIRFAEREVGHRHREIVVY
ncbi:unnamed protein product [Angiostrongylus costaricensis]|uniref:LAM_G_DOMAIN domain-containing protein n=1 Tax=Angiostrongylus costaricensis TaxID=334426 RepID=A0A0R3PJS3_ANGCS|nr:unnamed protein product [Angiostrongylus costaricensis]